MLKTAYVLSGITYIIQLFVYDPDYQHLWLWKNCIKKDRSSKPCFLVPAPPTPNTMTATRAIQPTYDSTRKRLQLQELIEHKFRHKNHRCYEICR